ncbi:MAG: cation:proton antiporter, partial [Candidatus Nitrosocosmicus sp.]
EMSLIVAKGGIDIGVASSFILPIVGTITIISTFLSPYLIKLGLRISEKFKDSQTEQEKEKE